MTSEERQRTMALIVKRQESFAESIAKADVRMSRLESALVGVSRMIAETGESLKKLTDRLNSMRGVQAHTDERLNILITTVERYFSNKRNGESRT